MLLLLCLKKDTVSYGNQNTYANFGNSHVDHRILIIGQWTEVEKFFIYPPASPSPFPAVFYSGPSVRYPATPFVAPTRLPRQRRRPPQHRRLPLHRRPPFCALREQHRRLRHVRVHALGAAVTYEHRRPRLVQRRRPRRTARGPAVCHVQSQLLAQLIQW